AVAVLLLAKTREDASDGSRERKNVFSGDEFFVQLRLMRHRTQPAADEDLEAADFLAVDHLRRSNAAKVVERHQRTRFMLASAERDLELAAKVLRVRMPQQVIRAR